MLVATSIPQPVKTRMKSRLVHDGRSQSEAQSGENVKSCTPRQATILMHFGLAPVVPKQVCRKADLTAAFLKAPQHTADGSKSHVRLPADIAEYKQTPDGRWVEIVYELKKSLCGQRNSPQRFEILFSNWMINEAGMARSTVDPSIYYSRSGKLRVLQFVDDSCLIGCPVEAARFEKLFKLKWGTEFENCDYYLNMRIRKDADGYYSVAQPHYAEELLSKYGMKNARKCRTPLVPGANVTKEQRAINAADDTRGGAISIAKAGSGASQSKRSTRRPGKPSEEVLHQAGVMTRTEEEGNDRPFDPTGVMNEDDPLVGVNHRKFQEVLGALSYYANTTRPDIAQAVSMMGQVSAGPRMSHWRHLQHILRYIKAFPHQGIRFAKPTVGAANILDCYVDSSFADGPEGKSTTGYCLFLNGGCVAWRSRLQKSATKSTMESEVVAACEATEELRFLNDLLYEMGAPSKAAVKVTNRRKVVIHEDNNACVVFNNTWGVTGRNKKMGRPCNFDGERKLHQWAPCADCKLLKSGRCELAHDKRHCIDIPPAKRHIRQNYLEVRNLVLAGEVEMIYCDTHSMVADCLTKALGHVLFNKHRQKLASYISPATGKRQ